MARHRFTVVTDFDDTIAYCPEFPEIGAMVPGVQQWLGLWSSRRDMCVVVWTNRVGDALRDAEDYLWSRKIQYSELNPDRDHWPCGHWNRSQKLFGDVVIDDRNACCPLWTPDGFAHPVVDWLVVGPFVEAKYNEWKQSTELMWYDTKAVSI